MTDATGSDRTEAFARLLRELKDRSGLSYGALAKRMHMSTSTLHRYCNGTAVPVEYAPVERLARVCRATPQELVELHRHWILADAARGRRTEQGRAAEAGPPARGDDAGASAPPNPSAPPAPSGTTSAPPATSGPTAVSRAADDRPSVPVDKHAEDAGSGVPLVVDVPPTPVPGRRRRTALIAAVAAAAVLGAVVLAVGRPFGGRGDGGGDGEAAGVAVTSTGGVASGRSPGPSASGRSTGPSAPASASGTPSRGTGSGDAKGDGGRGTSRPDTGGAVPLTVGTRPYVYEDPCSQHFLVDSEPAQVGPPANEQDAPRWAAAYGAVSSGEQRVALTVQGTGADTVVLEALHVRVLSKGAPLAWNDYSMGVGCGGGVGTKSFDVGLDRGSPTVTVKNGQRDFPYKVSESDPEVFYVTAHTSAHDVRWDLTLDWSSGSRRGTVRIDDGGTPFRTSADVDRPGYDYPLGGSEWIDRAG